MQFSIKNNLKFELTLLQSNHQDSTYTSHNDFSLGLMIDSSAMGLARVSTTGMKLAASLTNISAYAIRHNTTGLDATISNRLTEKLMASMHVNGLKLNL